MPDSRKPRVDVAARPGSELDAPSQEGRRHPWRDRGGRTGLLGWRDLILVVLLVAVFSVAPGVYSNSSTLVMIMIYALLSQGINVIYGFAGYLPFGYVAMFGAGAYGFALAILDLQVPTIAGVVAGCLAGLVVGVCFIPLFRLKGSYFSIATLAAAVVLSDIVGNPALNSVTYGTGAVSIGQAYAPDATYYTALTVLAVTCLAVAVLRRSKVGLRLRALKSDPTAAEMSGVNVVRYRTMAWMAAAAIAGLAGALFAWSVSIFYASTVFDLSIGVFAIIFALAGGPGTVWGPPIGAILLYGLYSYIGVTAPQGFQLLFGLLIIIFALFLPRGVAAVIPALAKLSQKKRSTSVNERSES